ncbi:O-antigen ligase family protein [Neobacillus sedimentimangrovi]|uniref:O-antigen ligase family protein n=1 Tax=Neobacillus sedimentimangrovi TaxID=2699460 RepID=UPI0013D22844|nr:O-antigen ligase family protein [Neobacillus sedimentimangrovi]
MSSVTNKRIKLLLAGISLVIAGLFIQHSLVGALISFLLALFIFYDEKIGILFLIIFVPIRAFLTVYNPGFKIIGDIIIFMLLLKTIYTYRKNPRELFKFHPFELAFFAFLIIGTISALITGVSIKAIIIQVRAFGLFYLLFYIVNKMKVSKQDINDFAYTSFFYAVFLSLQGLVEKISVRTLFLPEVWQQMELAYTNAQRVYGLMGGPNETAMFLLITIIIGFYLLEKTKGKLKALIFACLILIATVFILTYSRGVALTLIPFLPVYLFVTRKFSILKPLFIICVSAFILYVGVEKATSYVEDYQARQEASNEEVSKEKDSKASHREKGINRFSGAFSEENIALSNADGRVYYFKKALDVFLDKPVMGYGFGTYGGSATLIYSSPIYDKYEIYGNFYSDNQYTQLIAETGTLGVLLMLITVILLIKITWDLRKDFKFSPILIYFIIAAVVSGAVYNILENDVFTMFYFIILGYAYRYLNGKRVTT